MDDCQQPRKSDISLKEFLAERIQNVEDKLEAFAKNLEKRLETLNELRKQVVEDRIQFMPRDLYERMHVIVQEDVAELKRKVSSMEAIDETALASRNYSLKIIIFIAATFISIIQIVTSVALYFVLHK